MKAIFRKYVSLVVMLLLLVLIISWLPKEGSVETSTSFEESINSVETVSFTSRGIREQ